MNDSQGSDSRADATAGGDDDDALLRAACAGDRGARQRLCGRSLPALRHWARRWLPGTHAGINDADDLVQIALLRALNRLDRFEPRGAGAFLAYVRQILLNEVRAELRRQRRRGEPAGIDVDGAPAADPVLDHVLRHERERAYLGALQRLTRCQREHLALRIEGGMSFGEIAARTGSSADGARMRVARALRAISLQVAAAA